MVRRLKMARRYSESSPPLLSTRPSISTYSGPAKRIGLLSSSRNNRLITAFNHHRAIRARKDPHMPNASPRLIPLWIKIPYTAFMAALIPVYLYHYGPTNFLYLCDVAAVTTLVAVWIESPGW